MASSKDISDAILNVPIALWTTFVSTLADLPMGLALLDADGRFHFINHAFAESQGLSVNDHVDRRFEDVLPDEWAAVAPLFSRVTNGEFLARERSGETPGAPGAIRHWAEQWSPLRDAQGEVIGVAITATEITEWKRRQEELQRVADARDRLLGIISHELRGPLASVMGFAQRLERQNGRGNYDPEEIEIIYRQALEMRDRLDVLEAMSEQESESSSEVRAEALDLGALLGEELPTFQSRYPGIRFECTGEARVSTDPRLVREILSNLLDNAAKYGGAHEVVEIRVDRTALGAVIEVRDHGPGIRAELQDRLFELGFRTEDAAQSLTGGHGLGLYIANQLAHHLGGSLSVVSAVGDGASFSLHLPLEPGRNAGSRG